MAKDLLQIMNKRQAQWIRPVEKKDEGPVIQKFGQVDWDIPGHRQISDYSQARDIIEWSQRLWLIDGNRKNMWKPFGSVLSRVAVPSQKEAFVGTKTLPNPLRLTLGQKVFFLYLLFYRDGDFLLRFLRRIPSNNFSANDASNGAQAPFFKAWLEIAEILQSSEKFDQISRGKKLSKAIVNLKTGSAYLRTIGRLENLTDLGILSRANERKYSYIPELGKLKKINDLSSGLLLDNIKAGEERWRGFLESSFFAFAADLLGINAAKVSSSDLTKERALEAYKKLVGGLGLCRIDELALLTCIEGIAAENSIIIEPNEVNTVLFEMNKQNRRLASLHVDMLGNISYIKIDKTLLG